MKINFMTIPPWEDNQKEDKEKLQTQKNKKITVKAKETKEKPKIRTTVRGSISTDIKYNELNKTIISLEKRIKSLETSIEKIELKLKRK